MERTSALPDDMTFFTQITMEAAEDSAFLQAMARARIRALVGVEAVTPEGLKDVLQGIQPGRANRSSSACRCSDRTACMCWDRSFSACRATVLRRQGDRRPGGACGHHLRAVRDADALSGHRRLRALGTRGGWRRRDRQRHSRHAALAHSAGGPSEGLRTASRDVARRNPAADAGGVGPFL